MPIIIVRKLILKKWIVYLIVGGLVRVIRIRECIIIRQWQKIIEKQKGKDIRVAAKGKGALRWRMGYRTKMIRSEFNFCLEDIRIYMVSIISKSLNSNSRGSL